jgi:hypothetical protein
MGAEGTGRCLAVEGSTDAAIVEAYVEGMLMPTLQPGQVAVMDNISAHEDERVKELIEERGGELLYLPPYSPDFSPIEEAFSKIKGILTEGPNPNPRGPGGLLAWRSRRSAPERLWLIRALWVRLSGSIVMTNASSTAFAKLTALLRKARARTREGARGGDGPGVR